MRVRFEIYTWHRASTYNFAMMVPCEATQLINSMLRGIVYVDFPTLGPLLKLPDKGQLAAWHSMHGVAAAADLGDSQKTMRV